MAKILVVDDERTHRDLLRNVLSYHGHEVLTANGGEEGITLFKQRRPDFVLLDLRMPSMSGIDVLKELRAFDPHAAVMILTAWGTDELEFQARQLGVLDFLNKNVAIENVAEALEAALQKRPSKPASKAVHSILIADDDQEVRDLLKSALLSRGYAVQAAQDGPEVLALVQQAPPKVVILDGRMPGMTGVEVLRQLRAKQYTGLAILLTNEQELMREALDLGSVDFMGKPVDVNKLELAIQMSLGLAAR